MPTWKAIIGLLIIAVGLAACNKRHTPPPLEEDMLYRVECFYQNNPDSALHILDTLNLSVLSEKERAHYCLLKSRALCNSTFWNAEIDSLIQVAESYYIGQDDKFYEARTYTTRAYACQSLPQHRQLLLDNQLKAKQSINQCRHVDERLVRFAPTPTTEQDVIDRLKYSIYLGLGNLYSDFGYRREGIEIMKDAEQFYWDKQWYDKHSDAALKLGDSYLYIKEYDSSMMFLEKSFHSAEMIGDLRRQAICHTTVAMHLLYRYEKQKDLSEVERMCLLQQAISKEKEALENPDLKDMHKSFAIDGLAHAYFELKQYDSCIYYAKKALELNGLEMWKMNANMYLYKSYEALGDLENALSYAEKYMDDRRKFDNSGKSVSEVKEEYDRQLELQRVENEQQRKRLTLYLLISLLVIVLLLLWHFITRYRKNKEVEMLKLREVQLQLQSKLERVSQYSMEMLQQRVMDIYCSDSDNRMEQIMKTFDSAFPQVLEKLKAAYPDLNEKECHLVVLNLLRFRAKEEASILNLTENTVLKYRSIINKKVDLSQISAWIGQD